MLHGREEETARLTALLTAASEGQGSAVLLHGEAGTGKSALLAAVADAATEHLVLRTVGLESESPLPFAALHRLLQPIADLIEQVPEPQAQALQVAFGEIAGRPVDPFVIALATLSLLSEAAQDKPVLCLIDDAQWLDAASAEAFLFAARRMQADPVTFIFAAREGGRAFESEGITRMPLGGISREAARGLLESVRGSDVADYVVDELLEQTGGNPLALVELLRGLSPSQLAGSEPLPRVLALGEEVERVFLERCRGLLPSAQAVMLVAAADDSTRVDVVQRAAADLGAQPVHLDVVERAGLLDIDGLHLGVRHPLVRSAVYQAATARERREVHAALARALSDVGDADRSAWHLAAAVDGPDEAVAQALEAAGARAAARSGHAAASAAYERAAELSVDDETRALRLFAAARFGYASGLASRAMSLLSQARHETQEAPLLADIARLRGRIEVVAGSATDAHRIFVQSARSIARIDPVRALEQAALAGVLVAHGADSGTRLEQGAVSTVVGPDDSVRVRCLRSLLAAMDLDAASDPRGALDALQPGLDQGCVSEDRGVWANLANAALHLGDDASHRRYFTAMLSAARDEGAVMEVLYALHRLPLSELAAGEWASVRGRADEALGLARSIGLPSQTAIPLAFMALVAAMQDSEEYDGHLAAAEEAAAVHPLGVMTVPVEDLLHWAKGTRADPA